MQTPPSGTIRFDRESEKWFAGLPVGNGRTGAVVTGGLPLQTLHLNDETFWSPGPRERAFDGARPAMDRVRERLAAGDVLGAQAAARPLLGEPPLGAALQPIGDLTLSTAVDAAGAHFSRSLDLTTGVVTSAWEWDDGRSLTREVLASRSPSVFLIRQRSRGAVPITRVAISSPFGVRTAAQAQQTLLATGRWHEVTPNRALVAESYRLRDHEEGVHLRFAVAATALAGESTIAHGELQLTSRDWTLAVAVQTDYTSDDPSAWAMDTLRSARRPVDALIDDAIAAHATVFDRSAITLEVDDPAPVCSTDRRIHAVRAGGVDDGLAILLADYGRYLQIASTLGGSLPPTLQGIWNVDTEPAWSSNYTLNINLQMSLWSASALQFPEAMDILQRFVERLSLAGRRTAAELYGAKGWVVHHNSDLWLNTAPTTLVEVGLFAGAGLWLVQQLMRHHESYPEASHTRSLFDLLVGATEFLETWLVVDDEGFLATSPSSSPENAYLLGDTPRPRSRAVDPEYWRHGWIGNASSLDMLLVRDTLASSIALGSELGAPAEQLARWSELLERLRPVHVQDGEIPEWTWPYRALELGHRHLSPLYGLYPGADDFESDSELRAAARTTLENRLANVTSSSNGWGGWSKVWAAACWARLGEGDRALASIYSLMQTGIAPDSLLHAFPDFDGEPSPEAVHQSDANLGVTAAVVELLVGSRPGRIQLLPALPTRWVRGRVRAIRASGGVDVTFDWADGRVESVHLLATVDQTVTVTAPGRRGPDRLSRTVQLAANTPVTVSFTDAERSTQEEVHK
jgi:alpha-L-fucosidase 2